MTMARPLSLRALGLLLLGLCSTACKYRPAHFADAPPVTEIADDEAIDVPPRLEVNDVVEFSDLFLGRPLIEGMRPTRKPPPGDINSIDEVPTSSWFSPLVVDEAASFEDAYAPDGPPVPPFRVLLERAVSGSGGIPVIDGLGHRFELRRDPADRLEVRTAAAAISARLLRALGYFTPEVYISDAAEADFNAVVGAPFAQSIVSGTEPTDPDVVTRLLQKNLQDWLEAAPAKKNGTYRFSATRWAPGIDVGRTAAAGLRRDDPNDHVAHEERRTLRALKVVGAWLGMLRFTPHDLRDVYLGAPGDGHIVHYLVVMDKSLGTEAIVGKRPEQRNEMLLLGTLGFAPDPNIPPTQRKYQAIGAIGEEVDPKEFRPGLPFPPMDRLDGADAFWIAKRIAGVGEELVLYAVRAGKVSNGTARRLLFELILARQKKVVEWGYAQTTPCDVEGWDEKGILVTDRAVQAGFTEQKPMEYVVSYLDSGGETTNPGAVLGPEGARFVIPVPRAAFAKEGYAVVRLRSESGGKAAPRWLEVHLKRDAKWTRILGVRH
jgi:hypothetical protein